MSALLYPIFTIAQIALLVWGIRLYLRQPSRGLLFVIFIAAGLVYDNFIIAIGAAIGVSDLLQTINVPRFIVHGVFTPLLLIAGYEMAQRAGVTWFNNVMRKRVTWVIVAVLIVVGLWQGILTAHLKPVCHDGTLRYAERVSESQMCSNFQYTEAELNERGLPPIASIITIILVAVEGEFIGRKIGWWGLCIGGVLMFIGAAVPASRVGPVVANGAEVILVASAVATEFMLQKRTKIVEEYPALKVV